MVKIALEDKYLQPIKKAIENKANPYNNKPILQNSVVKNVTIPSFKPTTPIQDLGNDKPIYNPYNIGKDLTELDPVYQDSIMKSLSKHGLFGEKGIEYNLDNILNKAAQLPQSMINAGGFLLDTLGKVKFSGISAEGVDRVFNTLEKVDNKPQAFTDTLGAIDTVSDFNEEVVDSLKAVKFVQDRSQEILKKYDGKIGSVDKFAGDVLGNAIDMIPTLAIAYSTGGTASMTYLFASAGAKAEEDALKQGATEDEAFTYGVLNGGIEAGTEMLFAGIGGIAGQTMPKWSRVMSAKFSNVFQQLAKSPITKAFISQLVDVAGEGFEEVLAEVLGNYAKLVYTEEIKSGKELVDDALYAGLLGMFTSGFMKLSQQGTLSVLETVANQGTIQNLSKEQSIALSRSLANKLNYDFEVLSQDESIQKYGTTEKTKENITSGNAFVVKESRQDGKSGSIVIVDRGGSQNILATSTMHEVTHIFENTKTYNELTSLVKSHMGDEQYQEFVNEYAQLYKVEQDDMYKSGIRMSESEFVAQQIIQNQLFGLNSKMRTSFVQKLAGEKPKLFTKLSDNIDSFLNRMKTKFLDSSNEDDRNVLEYIEYMENLKMVFEQANDEYQSIKDDLNLEDEFQPEVKMQKSYEEFKALDVKSKSIYQDENLTMTMVDNFSLAKILKNRQSSLQQTFNLSEEELNTIFETLDNMSLETANDTMLLFESVNDALDGKFKTSISALNDKEVVQYNDLFLHLKQLHTYLHAKNEIDTVNEVKNRTKLEQERLELSQNEYLKALENNPITLNGEVDAQDLIVLHNITEEKLQKALALGGFAMPSLAVTKSSIPHADFGDITIVFNKDILNDSPTFTADAYTPRVPRIVSAIVSKEDIKRFEDNMKSFKGLSGYDYISNYISALNNSQMEDANDNIFQLFKFSYQVNGDTIKFESNQVSRRIYEEYLNKEFISEVKFEQIKGMNNYSGIVKNYLDESSFLQKEFLKRNGAKEYFRNDIELFTNNGRRPIGKLYDESNLANLVKYMSRKNELVGEEGNFDYGLKQRKALLNSVMNNSSEVAINRNLLNLEDEQDYNNYMNTHNDILANVQRVSKELETRKVNKSLVTVLDEFLAKRKNITPLNLEEHFKKEGFNLSKLVEDEDLLDTVKVELNIVEPITYSELLNTILTNIKNKQVSYFESKPRRAVEFSEIEKVLLPKNSSQELKDALNSRGIPFVEYEYSGNDQIANGRIGILKQMKEVQFQLVPTFKEDSNGLELTEEQLTPIMLSKALDENGAIKVFNRRDKDGYFNIKNPFDTRTRRNAALTDKFIQNNNIELVNGLLNENDANLFLAFLSEQGQDFDGIIYNDNGSIGYVPLEDAQFYHIESLEYTNTLLSDLKGNSGLFSNFDNQVREMQESAQKQTEQAIKEFYQVDYDLINQFNITSQEAYDSMEDFRNEVNQMAQDLDVEPSALIDEMFNSYKESVERYSREGFEIYNRIDNKQKGIQFQLTPEQNEFFKDSKARDDNGKIIPFYHGTFDNNFTVFDKDLLGSGSGDLGFFGEGFYFARDKREAKSYGSNLFEVYLNIKKPFNIQSLSKYKMNNGLEISNAFIEVFNLVNMNSEWGSLEYNGYTLSEISKGTKELLDTIKIELAGTEEDYGGTKNIYKVSYENKTQELKTMPYVDKSKALSVSVQDILKEKYGWIGGTALILNITEESKNGNVEGLSEYLQSQGYDGIIQGDLFSETDEVVVFNANQIKRIDNLNPTLSDDIRFQLDEGMGISRFGITAQQTSTQEVKQSLENDIANGKLNYIVQSDVISVRKAHESIAKNGVDVELANLKYKLENGQIPTKLDIAIGEVLIRKLSQERRVEETKDLITSVSIMATELGQAIQALSLLNKLSPTGQLIALEKGIKRIEKSYEKLGKPNPNLRIPEEYRNYFIELEGRKQDLQDSQEEYNNLVERMTQLENEIKGYEEQNKSIQELNQIESQIDVLKEQQKIDVETQKRIDGLQLELDELNALPKVSDDLKQLQTGLKNEISSLLKSINKDNKAQENIFKLEAQLKILQLEVGEDSLEQITQLKQQIKDTKASQKKLNKLNKMLDSMTNQKAIENKIDEVKRIIAKQMPVTWVDKLNAWRYLSMLGNPRTHIRNILGNGFFYPVYVAKDVIGVAMEQLLPQSQRTKSLGALSDVELKQFVMDDFKEMQKVIATTTKYDLTMDLAFNKTIFKTNWLENVRNKNFDWLEKEDVLFMRLAYTHSLGMVIKARGWDYNNLTEEQLSEARKIATDDARKATYRDVSKFASWLNSIEKSGKTQAFFMAAILPFKKTPINILKRGVEYSPVSIIVGIKQFAFDVKSGKATPAQAMDSLTTGLSGMALMGLGGLLFSMGLLNVGDDDDENDKKKYYDRSMGKQRYSLNIFGGTYTIDWIVPAIMPLMIGGELAKAWSKESDESVINQIMDASFSILDPVFELSMLQGVTQTLTSYSSSGSETIGNIISTSIANLVGQLIPTLSGQIARILDPVQRSTLGTKNSPISKFGEETLRKLANKLPLSIFGIYPNAPVVDVRGNEVVNYENIFTRTVMNLFSPGYYKDGTLTEQDKEIIKIYELTQESGVIPKQIPRDYQFEGKKYILDNQQTANFGKILGRISYEELSNLMDSNGYQNISVQEKAILFEKIYEYAWLKAKEEDFNSRKIVRENGSLARFEDDTYQNIKEAEKNGIKPVDYLKVKGIFAKLKGEDKQEQFYAYLRENNYDVNLYGEIIGGYKVKSDLDIDGLDKIKIEGLEKLKIDGLEKLN